MKGIPFPHYCGSVCPAGVTALLSFLRQNVAIRRQKPGYRPDDQDEWDEQGNFRPKTLLSQYDEQLDGEKKSSFVIGELSRT